MENLYLVQVQPEEDYPFVMLIRTKNEKKLENIIGDYANKEDLGFIHILQIIKIDAAQESSILAII